jgi:hypothetical protein
MTMTVFCDAAARGFVSAALKIPVTNMAIYTLVDMVVSYGFFLKLCPKDEQTFSRRISIIRLLIGGIIARIVGCFAGFAMASGLECPVRLRDAVWMSCASTVVLLPVLRKFAY